MICIDKEYKWNWGFQENMKYFLMFCFMKGCGPFAKVIDQNN